MLHRPPRPTLFPYTTLFRSIYDLNKIGWVLGWDQRTMMPPKGARVRAEQLATIGQVAHEKFVAPEIGDRKSTRLNSSHLVISYAVFCLKKKKRSYKHLLSQS